MTTFAELQKKYRWRLSRSRDGRKRHIQRFGLASGWTLSSTRRKAIREKRRKAAQEIA